MNEQKNKKNLIVFVIIIVVALFLVGTYFFINKKSNFNDLQGKYENFEKITSSYEAKLKSDVYGGKTPQETLDLFIKALEKGDMEEAGKYFWIGIDDSQKKWQEALRKNKEEGRLSEIVNILKKAEYEKGSSSEDTAWFSIKDENGVAQYSIILRLNRYTGVWKIEEM